ncbi:MAG: 23S rRNA (adenine(2030)-N(6))-methyltransferase RlmJ [Reinekea sp.]
MLSYRHGYHAGNFADVLKHFVQVELLKYLHNKDKPFDYIDTHAGAGRYQLNKGFAKKKQEYLNGITKLWPDGDESFNDLHDYLALIRNLNQNTLTLYPGSADIAAHWLREQDKGWYFELHGDDFQHLQQQYGKIRRIKLRQEDGFKALSALLPTQSRRALVLIDPPYELKEDYRRIISSVKQAYKKMPQAIFAIWYPVVDRARVRDIQRHFQHSGIRNIVRYELGIQADTRDYGMTSAGMIVINPPWTLNDTVNRVLPGLAKKFSLDGDPHYQIEQWVGE